MTTSPPFFSLDDPQHPAPRDGTVITGQWVIHKTAREEPVKYSWTAWYRRAGGEWLLCTPPDNWRPIAPAEVKPTDGLTALDPTDQEVELARNIFTFFHTKRLRDIAIMEIALLIHRHSRKTSTAQPK